MKLTDEQIAELAPDWSTHYYIDYLREVICFFNQYISEVKRFNGSVSVKLGVNPDGIEEGDKQIPRKAFDISEHEFSDTAKDCGVEFRVPVWVYPDVEINVKDTNGGDNTALLMKEHAIAIAKHFKLTAEDLK